MTKTDRRSTTDMDMPASGARFDAATALNLQDLCEATELLIAIFGADGRIRYANPAFQETFNVAADEQPLWLDVMRRNYETGQGFMIPPEQAAIWLCATTSIRGQHPTQTFEVDLVDGRTVWITETLQDNDWVLFVGTDVTDLHAPERSLRRERDTALIEANLDELTGISNRRHIMQCLQQQLKDADTVGSSFCGCLVDLDHFKKINDALGHAAGDRVLADFAKMVRETIRLCDHFGRVGGEEFLLLLPDTSLPQAIKLLARIKRALQRLDPLPMPLGGQITFSAGLAEFDGQTSASEAYVACDKALYAAKHNGRDQVQVFKPDSVI